MPAAGDPTLVLPFAHGGPVARARVRETPEDFVVIEELGYQASGEGEHEFLTVRKRERNTHDVARALARLAGVAQIAIGYAGLKDRNAVTTQHFTVHLPGRSAPEWSSLEDDSLRLLAVERHNRKIRRGSLRGNRFSITLRDVVGERDQVDRRLAGIAEQGVPNYFGSQRFGRDGRNLVRAADLFGGRGRRPNREQRGILLSAARSHLFNLVLAARVAQGRWASAVDGDVMLLADSQRQFRHDPADPTIGERLDGLQIHPSGPLCGRASRALACLSHAAEIEQAVLCDWTAWIDALARFGLDADRRALRLRVSDLTWEWQRESLQLDFRLTAGAYATAVLREVFSPHTASPPGG